ncbi:roadblock/LC7 domain-containing protein [Streptosporangium sp. G11]|uniref:roadblock/LC7 domain-containing protein n=1 Tax=Streptosporangium sp. G11 TaxID=3436926 RepID=UPI003EB76E0B
MGACVGVRHVVVFTADGLPKIWSEATERDDADRIAATESGLQSLDRSISISYGLSPSRREVMIRFLRQSLTCSKPPRRRWRE